jgi:hypothetical protein
MLNAVATINTKAELLDVTNPNAPISILGNCDLTVTAEDVVADVTGKSDKISWRLFNGSSRTSGYGYTIAAGLLATNDLASNGNTVANQLGNGNINVRSLAATTCPTCTSTPLTQYTLTDQFNVRALPATAEITANIFPNPSVNVFNLTFNGGTKEKLDVTVMDVSGRTVKSYKVDPVGTFRFGDGLRPGIYMIQVKQGQTNRVFKVIKQ